MKIGQVGWGTLAVGIGWLTMQAAGGTHPSFAQAPAQPAAAPASQAPTLGEHQPQAAGAPSWMEGMTPAQQNSTLHPNVANMLGHPSKDIPLTSSSSRPDSRSSCGPATCRKRARWRWVRKAPSLSASGPMTASSRSSTRATTARSSRSPRGSTAPNGVAFSNGTLFVAERERILRYDDIENQLDNPPEPKVVIDGLPHRTAISGSSW